MSRHVIEIADAANAVRAVAFTPGVIMLLIQPRSGATSQAVFLPNAQVHAWALDLANATRPVGGAS